MARDHFKCCIMRLWRILAITELNRLTRGVDQMCLMLLCEWLRMLIDRLRGGFMGFLGWQVDLAVAERGRVNRSFAIDWHLKAPSAGWIGEKQIAQIALKE